ncbi:MAG: gliding motility protein GldM [Bacteroidota bacterium]
MSSGKQTPRQKMINMMYLVLTALLALNISKEVLNAFVLVNESLVESQTNLAAKNSSTYAEFNVAMANDAVKTKPYYDKARAVKKLADEMINYIEKEKDHLIRETEKLDPKDSIPALIDVGAKDNYDIPTHLLCGGENDGKGHEASDIKAKLDKFKSDILQILSGDPLQKEFKKNLDEALNTADPKKEVEGKRTWEMVNFYHNPLVAVEVMLTKFQNDVKNTEASMINYFLSSIGKQDFKFDTLAARVVAPTSYVLLGQEYDADVFVAAYSTTQNPQIWLGNYDTIGHKFIGNIDSNTVKGEGGVGKYKMHPNAEGPQKWGGVIRVKTPSNLWKEYPFHAEYIAAKPALVVSPDKMNVFYIGVDNPVSISVPGIPSENVKPTITAGNIVPTKDKGKFTVTVSTPGETVVKVSAKLNERETKPMGEMKFRVKRIPNPVAKVAGMIGGNIERSKLNIQYGVIPEMENFDFDVKFTVVSFDFEYTKGSDNFTKSNPAGGNFTQEMKDVLSKLPPSAKVYFSNIKVKAPDGTVRPIPGINFKLL